MREQTGYVTVRECCGCSCWACVAGHGRGIAHTDDCRERRMLRRRAERYAAKWRADGWGATEPTDAKLSEAFAHCARVPDLDWFDAIREAISSGEAQDG